MKLIKFLGLIILSSCSVLSKSQVEAIENLSIAADPLTTSPTHLFSNLAEIRKARGIYYAASISTPEIHEKEAYDIGFGYYEDLKLVNRMEAYSTVLNSYIRALNQLASQNRTENIGIEMRGFGKSIGEVVEIFSEDENMSDLISISGEYLAKITGAEAKYNQASLLKDFITNNDTLVSRCVDSLVVLLNEEEVNDLFEHEIASLRDNYISFLHTRSFFILEDDEKYTDLVILFHQTEDIKKKCISGLKAFKKAHNKLITKLEEKEKIDFLAKEFIELVDISNSLKKTVSEIKESSKN